jgi:hypothetical protein
MKPEEIAILRRLLAGMALRFRNAEEGAPDGFGDFQAGEGVMTPAALVAHLTRLILILAQGLPGGAPPKHDPLDWPAACPRLYEAMAELDARWAKGELAEGISREALIQGPLADAMHHIGQVSMLRRLAGAPVRKVSFLKAELKLGEFPPSLPAA